MTQTKHGQSYWEIVRAQFKKNKVAVWSLRFLLVIIFIGVFADFIANQKPIICKYQDSIHFPIFRQYMVDLGLMKVPKEFLTINWLEADFDFVIRPLIPYSPQNMDLNNADFVSPFGEQSVKSFYWRHHLGTDLLGRDVMSGMIHGTRTAMLVGIISMSITTLIGIILGSLAGYYGDRGMQMSRIRFALNILAFLIGMYYAFGVRSYAIAQSMDESLSSFLLSILLSILILVLVFVLFNFLASLLKRIPFLGKKMYVPIDILISRMIEVKVSVPTLLLILSIVAVVKSPSIIIVMVIIGFTSWTGIAKYTRSELLKVRSLEYIQAAQSLGYSELRTIFKHALPNSLTSVLISVAFGVAGAIMTESNLSFLGIGVSPEDVTWGSMLTAARGNFSAWWLAIVPGFAIFITITINNLIGEGLNDAMDPRLKQ
ncbi:MAG: ABC transporter permease [Chitinophagales bacterium]|jgi:peptide/nickel transport system permease protein|nr:ABC transporter permease [Chitinophagales bacterium]